MKPETLKGYYNKIKFKTFKDFDLKGIETFPAGYGYLLIELVKRYKVAFKELGYGYNMVAIKTNKQCMIWRNTGIGATFLGLINLESGTVNIKDDDRQTQKETFKTYEELRTEIRKRNYNNILGLSANITEKEYNYFLNVLPPMEWRDNSFLLSECLSDDLYYKFISYPKANIYTCEIVKHDAET